ncbi:carboxylesterase family protein [Rothia nasimurium]|uniref:carboxylesterase family protein n=1 Tax=Rothia nasimurium TaxID=85336 RepID=UPI001F2A2617|nr:carboxylesterase family protein [Rothia nasimurium]
MANGLIRTRGKCRASGKRRYVTETAAKLVMSTIQAMNPVLLAPGRTLPVRVYRCPACKDFHLTSWERWGQHFRRSTPAFEPKPKHPSRQLPMRLSNLQLKELFDAACFEHREDPETVSLLIGAFKDWKHHKSKAHDNTREIFKMLVLTTYDEETWLHTVASRGYWLEPGMEEYILPPNPGITARKPLYLRPLEIGSTRNWLGIPYAEANRFDAPRLIPLESLPFSEYQHTPAPGLPQPRAWGGPNPGVPTRCEEGPLRLSISRQKLATKNLLPVVVFFHGGSYVTGGADAPGYDPAAFLANYNFLVVKVNYRLGLLGFLGGDGVRPANLGLQDALCALRWIKANIEQFGGDPNRVSVYGQSAGGDLVAKLLLAEGAVDGAQEDMLFHRAIIQSAPLDLSYGRQKLIKHLLASTADLDPQAPASVWAKASGRYLLANPLKFGWPALLPLGCQYGHFPLPAEQDEDARLREIASRVPVLVGYLPREVAGLLPSLPDWLGRPVRRLLDPAVAWFTERVYAQPARRFVARYQDAGGSATCFQLETGEVGDYRESAHSTDLGLFFGAGPWRDAGLLPRVPEKEWEEQGLAFRTILAGFMREGILDRRFYRRARFKEIPVQPRKF